MKWEYLRVELFMTGYKRGPAIKMPSGSAYSADEQLNSLGEAGWELIGMAPSQILRSSYSHEDDVTTRYWLIFKKPKA